MMSMAFVFWALTFKIYVIWQMRNFKLVVCQHHGFWLFFFFFTKVGDFLNNVVHSLISCIYINESRLTLSYLFYLFHFFRILCSKNYEILCSTLKRGVDAYAAYAESWGKRMQEHHIRVLYAWQASVVQVTTCKWLIIRVYTRPEHRVIKIYPMWWRCCRKEDFHHPKFHNCFSFTIAYSICEYVYWFTIATLTSKMSSNQNMLSVY